MLRIFPPPGTEFTQHVRRPYSRTTSPPCYHRRSDRYQMPLDYYVHAHHGPGTSFATPYATLLQPILAIWRISTFGLGVPIFSRNWDLEIAFLTTHFIVPPKMVLLETTLPGEISRIYLKSRKSRFSTTFSRGPTWRGHNERSCRIFCR